MWLIAGTVPEKDFPLYTGGILEACKLEGDELILPDKRRLPVARGTPALMATAIQASMVLSCAAPRVLLAGDVGTGEGSKAIYAWLSENVAALVAKEQLYGITFHYMYPDLDGHNRLYMTLGEISPRPLLVADAGYMYVAKMSGFASEYDLFTPDLGELAFLADEKAPHPFYTRGFLLSGEKDVPMLIERAIRHGNCPSNMIVKGQEDFILCDWKIVAKISEPSVAAMECIGGTGDLLAGFASAFLAAGNPLCKSALMAARASRYLAAFCNPDPACQISSLIAKIRPMWITCRDKIEEQGK